MKCVTCGYETQPGAKFCVQCGTTMVAAPPASGMAPLAAPSVIPRSAGAAVAASPAATMTRAAYTPPPFAAPGAAPGEAPGAALPASAAPVAGAPRLGLIAGMLALIAVLGIGSFVAYKMLFPAQSRESLITTDTTKATTSPAAEAPNDAPKDTAPSANNMTSQQASTPVETAPATTATPVVPQTPDTAKAPTGVTAAPRTGTAQTKAGPATGKSAAPITSAPAPAPAPAPTQQAAAPAAPAPQPDRWELMRQAHEACSRESLFDRLACNHRVGQQYCKGYWGLVPQCPAGAYGERGNAN